MRRLISIAAILCVIALCVPATASQEVIVDNPSAVFVGAWTTATSATDKYGADYRYINQSTSGSSTATYTPNIPTTASDWQVYTWYPTVSTSSTATQFKIQHALGETTVTISQSANRGMWVLLGTYTMNAGAGNHAHITNYAASGTRRAIADGMRFYSATAGDTTPPVITNVAQTHGGTYAVITWTTDEPATSQVEYGLTNGYGSQTTEDTTLVLSHSVQITGLTPETPYHYRVKSKDATSNLSTSGDYTLTTNALVAEYRAAWANTWNSGILGSSQIATAVNVTSAANFNVFIPEVRKCGDAYYNFSPVYCEACKANHTEPRATNIVDAYPYDPLEDMITKFHALDMKVYGWMVTYRIWNSGWGAAPADHVWAVHPDWVMKSNTGAILDGANYNLDPGIPAVQDYICKVAVSLVSHYDVDGINWDYIRYPGLYWGYNEITKQRYYDEYGYYPPTVNTDPNWLAWCNYRRQQVTDLLKKVQLEIMAVRPLINHTVCTVGWSGADPNTSFATTRQYSEVFQDTENWMDDHIIDTNILMNYKREYDVAQGPDYDLWTTWLATTQASSGRHSMDGQACYLNSITDSIHQMHVARTAGVGINNYDYITTNKDAAPAADFFNAVKAGVYQDTATVPDMPWKTAPTTGVIFGTVTDASHPNNPTYQDWIYKATVSITGPVTQSALTDATGTYGFMDLPPGTYTVSFSKTGFSPIAGISASIIAGQVARLNVQLAAPLAPGSYKTLAEANDPALVPDETTIGLNGNVVTTANGAFPDCSYIETTGRSSGLQVRFDGGSPTLTEGDSVNLIGKITTIADQRVLDHATLQGRSFGAALRPLGSSGRELGGALPTTGLLVTALGDITFAGADYFYINDGSALDDGSGHLGVKVLATGLTFPSTGFAMVTGINTREMIGGQLFQRIRARKQADITVY